MLPENAKEILNVADGKMKDAVAFLEEDLKTYRVGKANPSIFNNVLVDYYGTDTPIPQVASVSAPDAKTLLIQPWEKSMIPKIEKAILEKVFVAMGLPLLKKGGLNLSKRLNLPEKVPKLL